jgi:hypothetical protein
MKMFVSGVYIAEDTIINWTKIGRLGGEKRRVG